MTLPSLTRLMPLAHDVPVDRATIVRARRAAFASCLELAGMPAGYAKSGGTGGNELFAGYFAWERLQIAAKDRFLLAHAGQIGAISRIVIGLLPGRRT